ncbi:MAG: hypothetical protein ABIQ40_05300 [Bacteroidia bacterium]
MERFVAFYFAQTFRAVFAWHIKIEEKHIRKNIGGVQQVFYQSLPIFNNKPHRVEEGIRGEKKETLPGILMD